MLTSSAANCSDDSGISQLDRSIVFLDWPLSDSSLPQGSLLDGTDFSTCKTVFFDPWEFAVRNGLRSPDRDATEVEYVGFDEREFVLFLTKIKRASHTVRQLLQNGGTLVLRARIPRSHIKVRKRSSASISMYTASVVSTFFWLDDFLGKYSFKDCQSNAIRFVQSGSPLAEAFRECGVVCRQTQDSIGQGKVSVLAVGGPSGKSPVLSQVRFSHYPGRLYLIPYFRVDDEAQRLIQAFHHDNHETIAAKPSWLEYYERQIKEYNPFGPKMERIDLEIRALLKQKAVIQQQADEVNTVAGLLFEKGGALRIATSAAVTMLGFETKGSANPDQPELLRVRVNGEQHQSVLIRVAASTDGPVSMGALTSLIDLVQSDDNNRQTKAILLGNSRCKYPPDKRDIWFDEESIKLARQQEVCLLSSLDLYTIACLVLGKADSKNIEKIKESLQRDILSCSGLFQLNKARYGL